MTYDQAKQLSDDLHATKRWYSWQGGITRGVKLENGKWVVELADIGTGASVTLRSAMDAVCAAGIVGGASGRAEIEGESEAAR